MPELFTELCKYQKKAQPYLESIARGIKDDSKAREFLFENTEYQIPFATTIPLWQEQWTKRDPADSMTCPFWSNYWYEPCRSCNCRLDGSVSMEIDAMFFLRNTQGKTAAIHIEMKRSRERLSHGQAEAYRPRAACYRDQRRCRPGVLAHDYFVTVLFCGNEIDVASALQHFDRVISHTSAQKVFPDYPAG